VRRQMAEVNMMYSEKKMVEVNMMYSEKTIGGNQYDV
jgi:hypothetical protein